MKNRVIRSRGERGAALVEGALVFMIVFLTLIGIMEFGRMVWIYDTLAELSREGNRFVAWWLWFLQPRHGRGTPRPFRASQKSGQVVELAQAENHKEKTGNKTFSPVVTEQGRRGAQAWR